MGWKVPSHLAAGRSECAAAHSLVSRRSSQLCEREPTARHRAPGACVPSLCEGVAGHLVGGGRGGRWQSPPHLPAPCPPSWPASHPHDEGWSPRRWCATLVAVAGGGGCGGGSGSDRVGLLNLGRPPPPSPAAMSDRGHDGERAGGDDNRKRVPPHPPPLHCPVRPPMRPPPPPPAHASPLYPPTDCLSPVCPPHGLSPRGGRSTVTPTPPPPPPTPHPPASHSLPTRSHKSHTSHSLLSNRRR